MVGRGCFGDPWIFARANAAVAGLPVPPLPPLSVRIDTAVRQVEMASEQVGERLACIESRSRLIWYLRGVKNSSYWKQQLVHVCTLEDVRRAADGIKRELE
jgi:tRNA-dihydrouridine synthase B